MGSITLDTHRDILGPRHQWRPNPQNEDTRHTVVIGMYRKVFGGYPRDRID
jgi:hypothetical protein